MIKAIKSGDNDNVATLLSFAKKNCEINIFSKNIFIEKIKSKSEVPFGHKIAITDIRSGSKILKYNEKIGIAKKRILKGSLVHINEIQSHFDVNNKPIKDKNYKIKIIDFKKKLKNLLKIHIKNKEIQTVLENYFLEAQLKNIKSHGIKRLPLMIKRIQNKSINIEPKIKKKWEGSKLIIDADNTLGHYAMILAIREIKKNINKKKTISCIIKRSTHFGYSGYYSSKIADFNCISFVTSNGPSLMSPVGFKEPIVSNSPLSISAKIDRNKFFELDLATSVSSRAKIDNDVKSLGVINENLLINNKGNPTNDIKEFDESFLMPMQNYKGFGLALGLEVLTGVLSNGPILNEIKHKDKSNKNKESISHFIFAVKGNYKKRIKSLIKIIENSKTQKNIKAQWPGLKRFMSFKNNLKNNFFIIDEFENRILNNYL